MDLDNAHRAPSARFFHRLKNSPRYKDLISSNLLKALPIFFSSKRLQAGALRYPAKLGHPFALTLPEPPFEFRQIIDTLKELGIDKIRLPILPRSRPELAEISEGLSSLSQAGIECMVSLLPQRQDIVQPEAWEDFVRTAFSRLGEHCAYLEIGDGWNLPGKGIHDFVEYLQLAHAAFTAAEGQAATVLGPAVAGFRTSLYPPLLKILPFDKVSCQLVVSPLPDLSQQRNEKSFLKKLARMKAAVEVSSQTGKNLWVTDLIVPPLEALGENDQLVKFLVPVLSTGWVERIYLPWQLAQGSTGLKTLVSFLEGGIFQGKFQHPEAEIFTFCRKQEVYAVAWSGGQPLDYVFPADLNRIVRGDSREMPAPGRTVTLDGYPQIVIFEKD
jgi:hypothetical protein